MILFAALDFAFWKAVLLCAVALGLIIFVHELGHFLVAKWCGVRCDKFYIGFDFFGLKLACFKWGETEYGIGVFPLGGYVKMLGQEDNPGETRQRIEKAKEAALRLEQNAGAEEDESLLLSPEQIAEAERLLNDPRSYQSKSVPKRLAIIVAGVTMNLIFAFVVAVIAFMLGTYRMPSTLGHVLSGQGAWEAGLQPDDTLCSIGGNEVKYFEDIQPNIVLGDHLEDGTDIIFQREGLSAPQLTVAFPKNYVLAPQLGVAQGVELVLHEKYPLAPTSHLAMADNAPKGGDVLVQVNNEPVRNFLDYQRAAFRAWGERTTYKFARPTPEAQKARKEALKQLRADSTPSERKTILNECLKGATFADVTVEPMPFKHFGVVFEIGLVQGTRLEADGPSPARKAGIVAGDKLTGLEVDGAMQPIGDPMTLSSRIHRLAKKQTSVKMRVLKKETNTEQIVEMAFLQDALPFAVYSAGSGISIPELGVAFLVTETVASVVPGSEAAQKGLVAGDVVQTMQIRYDAPKNAELTERETKIRESILEKTDVLKFRPNVCLLPMMYETLQAYPLQHTQVALQVKKQDGETVNVSLPISEYSDTYAINAGIALESQRLFICSSFGRAIVQGAQETWRCTTLVFRTLGKLFTGQVSTRALGGPVLIAQVAYGSARDGMATLLTFCCLISANLAVMNLLPIPVLDGGHVIFLLYEGITGRAPNENLMIGLTYAGLLLFLGLTVYVFGLDLGFIPRM